MLFGGYCYLLGGITKSELDLVEIGLASLRRLPVDEERYNASIFEPLSVDVINSVLKDYSPLKELTNQLQHIMDIYEFSSTAKGPAFEVLALGSLCYFSKQHPSVTVAEFAQHFLPPNTVLPEWSHKAAFYISRIAAPADVQLKDEIQYAQHALSGSNRVQGLLLSRPSNAMRPDGFQLSLLENNNYWGLVASAKLYGEPVSQVEEDLCSTDLSKAYYLKNGTGVNPKAAKKRKEWDAVICRYNHVGSLRIHILLPSAASQVY